MIGIPIRVVTKLVLFAFIIGFIFLFVVHGYRFDNNTKSFVAQNVFVSMSFFSDDNTIVVNGNIYEPTDHKINFYNIEPGCYEIHFNGTVENVCYENNTLHTDSYVRYLWTKPYMPATFRSACKPISAVDHTTHQIGELAFSKPIQSAFMFDKLSFLQVDDKLMSCNDDYSSCKTIAPLVGDVVCGNKQWLVNFHDGAYELIQLK